MINRIHGGNISTNLGEDSPLKKMIDFSANINPLGLPSKTKELIMGNIATILHYPEPESKHFKNVLASLHNIDHNNLLIGNGSIEFIYLIPHALKVRTALIINPTFSEYEFAIRLKEARPIFVNTLERDDFKIDSSQIKKHISKVDLIFLCNPNNPTGFVMPREEILALLELSIKHNTILLIDEVFMEFVERPEELTLVAQASKKKSLLVLRSLTKFFALPGLRLGYLVGQRDLIAKISQFQYPWNVNALAQAVGGEVIRDTDYIKRSREFILKEREYLFDNLRRIKTLKVYLPSSNFIFCKLEKGMIKSSKKLNERLIKQGLVIRTCDNFRGLNQRFFRVAVRTRKENIKLISSLKEIL